MDRKLFQVKLTYFKASGKWYADGECEIEAGAITVGEGTPQAYTIAYTPDLMDAVVLMDQHPDLRGRWTEGPILITGPEVNPPHLITDLEGLTRRARQNRAEIRHHNAMCEIYRADLPEDAEEPTWES